MPNVFIKDDTMRGIADAIRERAGISASLFPDEMRPAILAIPAGGDWQPPIDWWDIKTMVNTGVLEWSGESVPFVRYGYVVSDTIETTTLAAGYEYYLSDGTHYNSESVVIHTWNRAHDKPCFEGYMTRAVVVCKTASRDVAISQRSVALDGIASLYVYLGDCNITSFVFCGNSLIDNANQTIRAIKHNALTTVAGNIFSNYTYNGCRGLIHVSIPPGATNLGNYQFLAMNVSSLTLPLGVTNLGAQFFYNAGGLDILTIPSSVASLGTQAISNNSTRSIRLLAINPTIAANSFSGLVSLTAFSVPIGFRSTLNLSTSLSLSVSSLEQLISNAADMSEQTAITFTIGPVNLAKLSEEYKALAASKNIVLV